MKCIKYIGPHTKGVNQPLLRVSDEEAAEMVQTNQWVYVSKSEFKKGQKVNG